MVFTAMSPTHVTSDRCGLAILLSFPMHRVLHWWNANALLAPKSITKSKVDNYRVKLVWIGRQLHLSQGQTI